MAINLYFNLRGRVTRTTSTKYYKNSVTIMKRRDKSQLWSSLQNTSIAFNSINVDKSANYLYSIYKFIDYYVKQKLME